MPNGIVLSHRKEWKNAIGSNMNGPGDSHTKWSQSNRERQISPEIANMQTVKKNDTNEIIYKTKTDLQT